MFERRDGRAFHFNSGKPGKFIQCEFETQVRICRVRLIQQAASGVGAALQRPTFVVQASRDKNE